MKLSEYFEHQQPQEMPSHIKSELFSRIQKEKIIWTEISTKLPSKMFSFFTSRQIVYASLATLSVMVVFWGILLDRNDVIDLWILSVQKHINPNWVLADYVAEVVEFNGEYSLQRNGEKVSDFQSLKMIEEWDIVTLSEWTDLLFNLTDWTQSKIVWPAEFSISKWESWYQISLIDGKFFRIYCPECASDIEIVTPDLSIHQDKNQALDIHIAKEDNWQLLVKNDGDDITVVSKKWDSKQKTELTSEETVSVTQHSDTIDILKDSDLMSLFLAKNNISATFTLSTEQVDWPTIPTENKPEKILAMQTNSWENAENTDSASRWELESESLPVRDPLLDEIIEVIVSNDVATGVIDDTISSELGIVDDGQKVPATNQMESLRTNLNSFFLMNLFESIYEQDSPDQNISRLADRINAIASAFGYSDYADSDLSSIKNTTLSLKDKLEKDWYISPSYILQMEKVAKWCDELVSPSQDSWDALKSNLPLYLRLM